MADKLTQIKAQAEAATPGPWVAYSFNVGPSHPWFGDKGGVAGLPFKTADRATCFGAADAAFIAACREDVPWLIAEVERLREWKAAILEVLNANGYGQMQWAGDRDGWGAAFEYIAWAFREKDKLRAAVGVMERRQVWPQLFGSPGRWGVAVRRCQHVSGTGPVNALLKAEEWFLEHNPSNAPEPDACRELLVSEVERLTAENAALLAELAERRWTKAVPTKGGYYWWRKDISRHATVVHVQGEWLATYGSGSYHLSEAAGEWFGPLPAPATEGEGHAPPT